MAVPYIFATATSSIPLSQLDSNFSTPITLGNTSIQLGNTVTTLNNMTLANVTISSGTYSVTDATVSGNLTLSGGTANGVAYLNGSKVLTTGSALTFDGITFKNNGGGGAGLYGLTGSDTISNQLYLQNVAGNKAANFQIGNTSGVLQTWVYGGSSWVNATTIDSSGNLGLGVTPSAWGSGHRALDIGSNSYVSGSTSVTLENNAYYNGTSNIYKNSAAATQYQQTNAGIHTWSVAPSGTAGNAVTFTQAMTLDASGNLGLGETNPAAYGGFVSKYAGIGLHANSSSGAAGLNFYENGTGRFSLRTLNGSAGLSFYDTFNGAERARITSGGEFYVAGTTDQGAYNIQCNGTGVWGAGAYVNGSDARIKEEIEPIDSGLDVVQKLNPVTYKYKEGWTKDRSTQTGFIAQELQVALEGKNYVDGIVQQGGSKGYYSVAYQNIIPILTKAIQELNAKVEAQAAEIAALKSK